MKQGPFAWPFARVIVDKGWKPASPMPGWRFDADDVSPELG